MAVVLQSGKIKKCQIVRTAEQWNHLYPLKQLVLRMIDLHCQQTLLVAEWRMTACHCDWLPDECPQC